jgi:immune inhibitor A
LFLPGYAVSSRATPQQALVSVHKSNIIVFQKITIYGYASQTKLIPLFSTMLLSLSLSLLATTSAMASAPRGDHPDHVVGGPGAGVIPTPQHLSNPLAEHAFELKQRALERRLEASSREGNPHVNKIEQVAKGQFVQMAFQNTDNVWTLLGEFEDYKHNEIPKPSLDDNANKWEPDFSRDYFQDKLFGADPGTETMTNYFQEQSGGRYLVDGNVEDWIELPQTRGYYGNDFCGGHACTNVWEFVCDAANKWYERESTAGKTNEEIKDYLSAFDVWDRYDFNGDGNFDEPDGYIDHALFVHASLGQEASSDGDDIWSHRWYAYYDRNVGPSNGASNGGCEIGNSGK